MRCVRLVCLRCMHGFDMVGVAALIVLFDLRDVMWVDGIVVFECVG